MWTTLTMCARPTAVIALVGLAGSIGCSTQPTSPSAVQVAGTWTGAQTLTRVNGGECYGDSFRGFIGVAAPVVIRIDQSGSDLTGNVAGCAFRGTASVGTFTLQSVAASCQGVLRGVYCANGLVRDVVHVRTTITA